MQRESSLLKCNFSRRKAQIGADNLRARVFGLPILYNFAILGQDFGVVDHAAAAFPPSSASKLP